ncbi:TPA: restriction endonuclease subunit S [Vibrio diabolicus]
MELSAYEHYSESDILWVGQYPSHWNLTRVKYEAYVKARVGWHGLKSDDFTDKGPYLVTGSDFKGPRIRWSDCYHCDLKRYEQDPYIQLANGDLLITKDGTIGKVALVDGLGHDEKATLNSGVFVVRPLRDNFLTKFYFWLLQSRVFTDFVNYNKTGSTIVHLYQDTFVNFAYASPDICEQTQIANFLDHEITKIDTLIEKQQQLIKLLKEKRQAVISHAVTKGLNPQVPMKDSGVEWLGEVPEHWGVARLKQVIKSGTSISYGIVQPGDALEEGIPFIQTTNISQGNLALSELPKTSRMIEKNYPRSRLSGGEVILGIRASIGAAYVVPKELKGVNLSRGVARIQPSRIISSEFLVRFFQTNAVEQYWGLSKQGSTFSEVSIETVRELYVVIPPDNEQKEICSNIKLVSDRFEHLIKSAELQSSLLQERRTALISAAVTGKIDVRNWQAPTSEYQTMEQTA